MEVGRLGRNIYKKSDMNKIITSTLSSNKESTKREEFYKLFTNCPIPKEEILINIGLFEKRQDFSRQLFLHELYKKALGVHGVIMEFGTRWGQNLVTLTNLRGILEPYNYTRKIIGFDTFEGFPNINKHDGAAPQVKKGAFSVTNGYENYLKKIINYHESESPLNHIKKTEIIKGNASVKLAEYLKNNPETIIAMAYFDFDIYQPTKDCLELIKPYITKGTVLGFDELNDAQFPGETVAVREVFGLNRYAIHRNIYSGKQSYLVID